MTTLQVDYGAHPAFRPDDECWTLSDEARGEFTSLYSFLASQGRFLPDAVKKATVARCDAALVRVFEALKTQAGNERRAMFLADLAERSRRLLADDTAYFTRALDENLAEAQLDASAVNRAVDLARQKYFTGRLSDAVVSEMLRIAEPALKQFRQSAANGKTSRTDLSVNSGEIVSELTRILDQAFEMQGVNDSMSAYMGQRMRVGGLALELSVPTATWWRGAYKQLKRDAKTLYFHIDETRAVPKSIVYLSDVSTQTGATAAAPGAFDFMNVSPLQLMVGRMIGQVGRDKDAAWASEYNHVYHQMFGCPVFRSDFMKLPPEMRWNSHFGWDVIPDSDLEAYLVQSERKITGPAGTFLVFDGFSLLHRGGLVEHGERIALQVVFAPAPPKPGIRARIRSRIGRVVYTVPVLSTLAKATVARLRSRGRT